MTADVRAAVEMLVNEAGGYPPTAAELEAIPDARAVVDAALARMAQLEKVAELARDAELDLRGEDSDALVLLRLAVTELDNHPDTKEKE
jgi:hypothetical protein